MSQQNSQLAETIILETIKFIGQKENQMELLRQQLNHQIMFNLQDTYLQIAKRQTQVNIKQIAAFLNINMENSQGLEKFVKWNSNKNSLNLSFAEFSALLISKEDRLLAKIVIQRQDMGAIPNFLLQIIRKIFRIQLQIHQYCMNTKLSDSQLRSWLQGVIDENGDLDKVLLNRFLKQKGHLDGIQANFQDLQDLFIRYLQTTGNITAQRLKYLWLGDIKDNFLDNSMKFQKQLTCITLPRSPKSLASCKSLKQFSRIQLRSEYFDCLNRPAINQDKQIRKKKSIQKHMKRFDLSDTKFKAKQKYGKNEQLYLSIRVILLKLKQIIAIEQETENYRAQLCLCTDFYPVIFYDTIPKDRSNLVSASYFKDYLQEFGYKFQINSIYLLFRKYCKELNKLDFNNFCALFDVGEPEYYLLQKNRFIQSLNDISIETKKLFFLVINTIVANESKINQIRDQILQFKVNFGAAFDFLFRQYQQGLSEVSLKHFYQKYLDYALSRKEIKLIWKRLGLNFKNEEKILKSLLYKQIFPEKINRKNKYFKL